MVNQVAQADLDAVAGQLGRPPRGILEIMSRCPSGHPNVVKTEPRLDDGTPFPTMYYLTCPRLAGEIGTLEASGLMREMSARILQDPELAGAYQLAHESYLAEREAIGHVEEIDKITAGGMPTRVKCLHVLVGHSLAKGPGVNPLGDEALELLGAWWNGNSCGADWVEPVADD
ncbi:MAG: hypothetical protein JWQ91_2244 [Aeromicrobium sp.]|jgi:hypothetical protein|uniref:DUF501 domain-containing protein n=1 Tax=Aeromicrobium sp. TaxID=1871063 RepID=UPI00260205A5|nr:DUF501 domain-containing protein [Aeromicrobium sp.]MCW2825327.1 hypothetical protein [Aeromicrobium sp.]